MKGLYTALITPFTEEGALDSVGLRLLIQRQIDARVEGIVVLGTTGETPTLEDDEADAILKISLEMAHGNMKVIVGTGSNSTRKTIENTKRAKELGAGAAMVITPYYNKPTQQGIVEHFRAINDEVDFPLIVYNHQGRTGTNIETSTLKEIAKLKHVVAVKEASGNIHQITDVIAEVYKEGFTVLSGDDAITLPLIALGGEGLISVVGNLYPKEMKTFVDSCLAGDWKKARELHQQLLPIFRASNEEPNPIPIKAMMAHHGLPAGLCRPPLTPPTHPFGVRRLDAALVDAGLTASRLSTLE